MIEKEKEIRVDTADTTIRHGGYHGMRVEVILLTHPYARVTTLRVVSEPVLVVFRALVLVLLKRVSTSFFLYSLS